MNMTKLIRLKDRTYQELASRGSWKDTMDAIVARLLKANDNNNGEHADADNNNHRIQGTDSVW